MIISIQLSGVKTHLLQFDLKTLFNCYELVVKAMVILVTKVFLENSEKLTSNILQILRVCSFHNNEYQLFESIYNNED
jgi:hypothetical protein